MDKDRLTNVLNKSALIRASEMQLLQGYKERKFGGTVHTCIGQEVLPSILSTVISDDVFVISNHRGHGHFVAHTGQVQELFHEFLGKTGSPSHGIGGSQHLYAENFLSNGIQGCTSPFAVGIGMIRPTVIYMGDGTLGVGTVYEAINLSKLTGSKTLFVVEDNGISQTTPSSQVLSGSIVQRFEAFDIHTIEVDSANPILMYDILANLGSIWHRHKTVALVVKSYRLNSHSKGDDTRPKHILSVLPDPLRIFSSELGVDYSRLMDETQNKVSSIWNAALKQKNGDFLSNDNKHQIKEEAQVIEGDKKRINQLINHSIERVLKDDGLFIGEDIVTQWHQDDLPYGGAFGVSLGLSDKYDNVVGTSISESGLVGVAAGRAFASKKTSVVEIMFADFSTLIIDQLHNGVDKYKKMFGRNVSIPLVVRLPYGMGRGYGPTHSQSPFELFSGLTEVTVVSYTPFINYDALIRNISLSGSSAVVFEPKTIYGDTQKSWWELLDGLNHEFYPGELVHDLLVKKGSNPKFTLLTHGSTTRASLEAVRELELDSQVLIVGELYRASQYLDVLNIVDIPTIIVEETNCNIGPLWSSTSREISRSVNQTIVASESVENIPANSQWERNLVIDKDTVLELIKEALL